MYNSPKTLTFYIQKYKKLVPSFIVILRQCILGVVAFGLLLPMLQAGDKAQEKRPVAPGAKSVRPVARPSASDLELVEKIFQTRKRSPLDVGTEQDLSDRDSVWQSYWWSGSDALFNTKGLVITGQTDWGVKWKPYGLLGLEEQVTFERYGKYRHAHVGIGIRYAFTPQIASFMELRAQSSSAVPQEGLVRLGMHFSY